MKKPACYKELPTGYVPVKTVDAVKDKKFAVLMNVAALVISLAVGALAAVVKFVLCDGKTPVNFNTDGLFNGFIGLDLWLLIFAVSCLLIIVLHELTHGAVYKALTHEKLTFGISWSCAFCGVPNLYVTKKTALLSLLAPVTLFSAVFLALAVFTTKLVALLAIVLFAIHFGSCAGDLYDAYLLLFKYKGEVLLLDTGPAQTFYQMQTPQD